MRREFLGVVPYRHHGIELSGGRMAKNSPPGVRIVTFDDFARGSTTRVVSHDASATERDQAVERAMSMVGQHRYSLTSWNCEHFASFCATGVAVSQQVASVVAAFLTFLKALAVVGVAALVYTAATAE